MFFVKNMISLVLHKVRVFNFIFFWNDESVWFAVFHLCDVYVSFWTTLNRHIICCLGEGSHQRSWRVTVRSFGLKDKLEAASAELPRGWTRRISHTTGKLYFVNAPRLHKWIYIYMDTTDLYMNHDVKWFLISMMRFEPVLEHLNYGWVWSLAFRWAWWAGFKTMVDDCTQRIMLFFGHIWICEQKAVESVEGSRNPHCGVEQWDVLRRSWERPNGTCPQWTRTFSGKNKERNSGISFSFL